MVSKEAHEKILNVFAIILLVLVLGNFSVNVFFWQDSWTEILWYCSVASIVLSLGILLKKPLLTSSVLFTAIPLQSFWILDFLLKLFGVAGFGRTDWLFELPLIVTIFSIILHFMIIPLAIYSVAIYGFKKKSVFFAVPFFLVVCLFIPFFFTSFEDNVNCVFYSCDLTFDSLEGAVSPTIFGYVLSSGSYSYLAFIAVRWVFWALVSYFALWFLFQRVFKKVSVV